MKLPYSLNIVSEAVAATALEHPEIRSRNVANTIAERARVFEAMEKIEGVTPFPSRSNFIAFTTKRYADSPLVIQGPGAGADVTAMGVFSDVLKLLHYLPR